MTYKYSPRYALITTDEQDEKLSWTVDVVRQLYNDRLKRFRGIPEDEGTLRQRVIKTRDELPAMKDWWDDLNDVYSTVLQNAVMRIRQNKRGLQELPRNGYNVEELQSKAPRDFRSFTYNKQGFELDKKSGPDGYGELELKKVAGDTIHVPIRFHRDLPDHESIQRLTIKQDATGEWFATFTIKAETPPKPGVGNIDPGDCVGIDLGVLNYITDSDDRAISQLDLTDERERLEREQRSLSQKTRVEQLGGPTHPRRRRA
jgi:putative transposase